MKDTAQTEEAPRIEMDSQTKNAGQKSCFRILHVDDDRCILEVSKQILSMENNFEIDDAISVDEAFQKMEKQTYDAVVSDYEMPLKNGLDFLRELREQKRDIPFILFTGKGREEVVVKALNLGADSYINKNGSPETVYCELADAINKTVERKKSKKALSESELKYRTVVEESLQGILITQTSPLRLVFANQSMGKILGYSAEELKSLSPEGVAGLIYNEDRTVFFKRLESRMHGEPANSSLEFRAVRKNGSIVWLEAFASRIEYMGQPAVQGMFLDIDERKKVSEILRESEARYRELANSLPDIVFETDINGQLVFANEKATEISGYSFRELEKGLNILQFVAPEDRERAMKSIQRLLTGGNYVPTEYTFVRKDGTTFPALITATPRISKNKMVGLRGLAIDITERKKAEEVVRKSEARYRELANFLPEIVFEADLTGKITFFSQRALEITGFTREELEKGMNMLSFVVPEEREKATENIKKSLAGEDLGANEYTLFRKNGTTYPSLVRTSPIISENKVTGLRGLVIDITEPKQVQNALRESEHRWATTLASIGDGVIATDLSGRITFMNAEAEKLTGWTLRDASQKQAKEVFNTIDEQTRMKVEDPITKVLEKGLTVGLANYTILVRKDATEVAIDDSGAPIKDENGNVTGAVLVFRDITKRRKAEEEISNSEKRFKNTLDNMLEGCQIISPDWRYIYINDAAARQDRSETKNLLGKTMMEMYPGIEKTKAFSEFQKCMQKRVPITMENEFSFPNGEKGWFELSIQPVPEGIFILSQDVSGRKKAEESLRESEVKFRTVAEFTYDWEYWIAPDGSLVYVSPSCKKFTGYGPEEFIKDPTLLTKIVYPEDSSLVDSHFDLVSSDEHYAIDFRIITRDGETRWISHSCQVVFDNDGNWLGRRVSNRDVTEGKKAEDALKQERKKLETVTASIGAGLVVIGKDYHVLWANDFIRRYKGNVDGKLCYATLNDLNAPCPDCGVAKIFAGKATFDSHEYCSTAIDGKPYWVEITATPIKDENGNVVAGSEIALDITKRKLVEQELQTSDAKFRAINESAIDAIFLIDEEDRISYWNPAAERIFGFAEKEIVGEKVNATIVPPRFRKDHLNIISKLAKGENKNIEGEILEFPALRKDGTEFSMEFSITPLQLNGKQHFIAIARDITERKKAEEALNRTMNELVLVNEKLNVVGSLTRHDVRNKLSVINGNVFILKRKHPDCLGIMDQLGNMEQACKSIDKIFDFAKMYERLGVEELSFIDVEKTIDEAVALFSGSLNVNVINDCPGLTLFADSFLRQLFYNLIDNSIKHGGHVTKIRVYFEKVDESRLIVVYEDDGVGISAVNKPQLFKEGFSTGGTSGYGLYLIKKMMEVYGWAIQENGEPDKGAKFTITIPWINQKGKENFRIV